MMNLSSKQRSRAVFGGRFYRLGPAAGLALALCVGAMPPALGSIFRLSPSQRLNGGANGESGSSLSKAAQIGTLIHRVRSEGDSPYALAKRLSDRGLSSLPLLLDILESRRYLVEARKDINSLHPLEGPAFDAVQAAVAMYPWPVVKAQIESRLRPNPSLAERKRALKLMAAALPGAELRLLECAFVDLDRQAGRALGQPFMDAVSAILVRDPAADEELAEFYSALDPVLLSPLVKTLRGLGEVRGATALSSLLGLVPEADPLLLLELADLARTVKAPMPGPTLQRIRRSLHSLPDTSKVEAVKALGRFDDVEAIPELIVFVQADHKPLAEAARRSLEMLSRERHGSDAEAWRRWYEAAEQWLSAEAPTLVAQIHGSDPSRARRALLKIARYRVFRHTLTEGVASALSSSDTGVVEIACTVLGHFATPEAIPPLIEVLGSNRGESTRKAAFDALVRATGGNHGEQAADWIAAGWTATAQ